jgi:MEDS: MEthanogen/methylotroph, DcmR Sensory domain
VRPAGVVESAVGLGPGSHVGWGYADRAELRTRAGEYLSDGIAAGQRIEFLGSGSVEALRAELAGLAGAVPVARRRRQFNQDRIGVALVDDVYVFSGPDRVVNPVQSVAARVAATEDALAAGYTGLRAVVDATTLAGTSAQRAAYAHYEYLLDQQSSTLPLGTICAYDTATLGSAAVAEMACLHPFASRGASTFRLYAHDGAAFALAGEVDCSSVVQFADTLGRVLPLLLPVVPGPELVVDGRELEFIDHRGLLVLDRCAGELGLRLAMQTHRQTAAHIAEALGLQHLRVDVLA